jgi:hypothetical protein
MNAISFPVRPPIRPNALPTLFAAPVIAGPADDVTLERPSEAFDLYFAAVWEAFEAVCFAASEALEVVDSNRRVVRPVHFDECRRTARDADNDIMEMCHQETSFKDSWTAPALLNKQLITESLSEAHLI